MMMVLAFLLSPVVEAGCGKCGGHGKGHQHKEKMHQNKHENCPKGKCKAKYDQHKKHGHQHGKHQEKHGNEEQEFPTLTVHALKAMMDGGADLTIFDARSGKYDDGRRIPTAKAMTDKVTAEEAAKHIKSKDTLVVTYCSNPQCPASERLAKRLTELGYKNIVEVPAGIEGWVEAGFEFEKAEK
jgi:rhodanese-related sulfurtransferase